MKNRYQYLFDEMCMYYPFLTNDAKDWEYTGQGELTVTLNDGSVARYNSLSRSFTMVETKPLDEDVTEEECRQVFSKRLRERMGARGLTQTAISELSGISQITLSKYINGKALPGYYNLGRLAKALRCSVTELMYVD